MKCRRIDTCTVMWVKLSSLTCDMDYLTSCFLQQPDKWPYYYLIIQYLNLFNIILFGLLPSCAPHRPICKPTICTWLVAFLSSCNSSFGHQKAPEAQLLQANAKGLLKVFGVGSFSSRASYRFLHVGIERFKPTEHKPQM